MLQSIAASVDVDVEKMSGSFRRRVMALMRPPSAVEGGAASPGTEPQEDIGADITVDGFKSLVHNLQSQLSSIKSMPDEATPVLDALTLVFNTLLIYACSPSMTLSSPQF